MAILMMAGALGMDAFSLGIGIGMKGVRRREMLRLACMVGLFHAMMPLLGMIIGQYMSQLLDDIAILTGGGLLVLLGAHMIYSSIRGEELYALNYRSITGLLLFSLSVSIDAFSVGISLGLFASDWLITVLLFGWFGGVLMMLGLYAGQRISLGLGVFGEALGGLILLLFGIRVLW